MNQSKILKFLIQNISTLDGVGSKTKNLLNLQCLDLRVNKLGKRWEDKLKDEGNFPKLSQLRIA